LELGCGDGDPLLDLRARGLDVEGLDSSADMLDRCRTRATERGLDVVLHHSPIETMSLPGRYRSIYLAGPTFNLLTDDDVAGQALERIAAHLDDGGSALVPLFIPGSVRPEDIGQPREHHAPGGRLMRCTAMAIERDEFERRQTTLLRYELSADSHASTTTLEREWILHWHTQDSFRGLAMAAGLHITAVLDPHGKPAAADDQQFVFLLRSSRP
jgi:cyclopropane fatty-acyl-phospholipid synthase-like methyltransferase